MSLLLLFTGAGTGFNPAPFAGAYQGDLSGQDAVSTQGIDWSAGVAAEIYEAERGGWVQRGQPLNVVLSQDVDGIRVAMTWTNSPGLSATPPDQTFAEITNNPASVTGGAPLTWSGLGGSVINAPGASTTFSYAFVANASILYGRAAHIVSQNGGAVRVYSAPSDISAPFVPNHPASNIQQPDWSESVPTQGINWYAPDAAQGQEQFYPNRPAAPTPLSNVWYVGLTWGAVSGATSYNVYRSLDGVTWTLLANTAGTAYDDHGGLGGFSYFYRVAGVGASGEGAVSNSSVSSSSVRGGFFDYDAQQDVDRTTVWPTVDTGGEHVESRMSTAPTGTTIAFNSTTLFTNVNWTPPPGLTASDSQVVFYATDPNGLTGPGGPDSWTYFNAVSTGFTSTGVGTLDLNHSPIYARVVPWLNNTVWGAPSTVVGPVFPVSPALQTQPDWSEAASNVQTWATVETGAEFVFTPAVAPFNPANGFDWSEQPGQDRDITQVWFAPEVAVGWGPDSGPLEFQPTNLVISQNANGISVDLTWTISPHGPESGGTIVGLGASVADLSSASAVTWNLLGGGQQGWPTATATITYSLIRNLPVVYARAETYIATGPGGYSALITGAPSDIAGPFAHNHPAPSLQQPDWSESASNAQTWFEPNTGSEFVFTPTAAPFDPATGFDWTDSLTAQLPPTTQQWFAEDATFGLEQGFLGAPQNPTATAQVWWNQFTWSAVAGATSYIVYRSINGSAWQVVSPAQAASPYNDHNVNTLRSYAYAVAAVNAFGVGALSAATGGITPIVGGGMFDWDGLADRDQSVTWYQPEDAWENPLPEAYLPQPAAQDPLFDWDAQQDAWQGAFWFAPEADEQVPTPFVTQATTAQEALWGWDASQDVDLTVRWYQPEDPWENPLPEAFLPQPAAQDPWQHDGLDEQLDHTQLWVTVETGGEFVFTPTAPVGPTTAQLAGIWQPQPDEPSTAQTWFAPDEQSPYGTPPFAPTTATVAQQPLYDWDAQQDRDLSVRWYDPSVEPGGPEVPPPVQFWYLTNADAAKFPAGSAGAYKQANKYRGGTGSVVTADTAAAAFEFQRNSDNQPYYWHIGPVAGRALRGQTIWFGLWVGQDVGPGDYATVRIGITDGYQGDLSYGPTFFEAPRTLTFAVGGRSLIVFPIVLGGITNPWILGETSGFGYIEVEVFWSNANGVTYHLAFNSSTPNVDGDSWIGFTQPLQDDLLQQVDGLDEQTDRTVTWYQPDTGAEFVFAPTGVAPFNPANGFDWSEQPGQERDLSQVWFAPDEHVLGIPPFAPSTATVPQQAGLWQEQPYPEAGTAQTWYQPEDPYEDPLPHAFTPPQVPGDLGALWQEQPGQEASLAVAWFAPDEQVWTPLPSVSVDAFPLKQVDSPDEQVSRDVLWFQDEHLAWTPTPFVTEEGVPTPQVDDLSEQVANGQTWFQDEHLAWVPVPALTVDAFPLKQVDDLSEQADRTLVWFQDEHAAWVPIPNLSVQSVPTPQVDDLSEQVPTQGITWYQEPDDTLGIPPFARTTATVPQQAGLNQQPDWSEQADRTIVWFAPDEQAPYLTPPFQPSAATVPQEALWLWDAQQDRDLTQTWFQDEHLAFVAFVSTFTIATVPQQAPAWPEQPVAWTDWTPWFAPDIAAEGFRPLANAPTHPDYGWDGLLDRWQDGTPWFAPDEQVWTPQPVQPTQPFWNEDGDPSEQTDHTIVWPTVETGAEFVGPAFPSTATVAQEPIQQPSADEEADRTIVWFQPDTELWTPVPNLTQATVAQEPVQVDGLDEQTDRTIVWFQPDTELWTPTPSISQATVAQEPVQVDDLSEQSPTGQTWFQPDTETWTPLAAPSTASVAQQPIGQPDPSESVANGQTWFQPDTWESYVPTPAITQATVAQEPIQTDDPSEQVDRTATWFAPDIEQGLTPFVAAPFTPANLDWGYDAQQDVDRTQVWFAPEPEVFGVPPFAPSVASTAQQLAATQAYDPQEQVDRTQTWFAPDEQAWTAQPPAAPSFATVPQQAPLWYENPAEQVDLTVRWFAPDLEQAWTPVPNLGTPAAPTPQVDDLSEQAPTQGIFWFAPEAEVFARPPLPNAPTHPDFGWDASQDVDLTIRWFAPDAAVESPVPPSYFPATTPQFPIQQPEPSEEADRTVRWFAPEPMEWVPIPGITKPTVAQTLPALQASERAEQVSTAQQWYQPEDDYMPSTRGATQIKRGKVVATDHAANLVTPTDAAHSLVAASDGAKNKVYATDGPAGLVNSTDSAKTVVAATDSA